jgi:TPR repeat protein
MTVPNLWDKTPEAPSPELNPLTNPVLEQNLGRWAKVYFGNPPAKREQAVNNLLEEIRRESGAAGIAQPSHPYSATDVKTQRAVCSACQHQNPPGHKFCSRCGQTLKSGPAVSTETPGTAAPPAALPPNSANDTQWLGDHAFSGLGDYDAPRKRGWKYLLGAAAVVLAGFAYLHWAPGSWPGVASTNTPQASAPAAAFAPENSLPAEATGPGETTAPKSVAPEFRKHDTQNPLAVAEVRDRTAGPGGIQTASQKSPLLDATTSRQTFADQGSGAPDLRLAQRYLGGSMGVRDSSEAAKLLWKAVSKQNATAAVLLSDLYLRGDGVPRSCDQARLLLVAAAKRGSPLAAQQLRNLESQGCQ